MSESLKVDRRSSRGTRDARRLRRNGSIPAVLYGHGEESVSLTVASDAMAAVMRHGGRVVDLAGAMSEKALIRDLQWDTFGTHLVHVDFTRVSEHERIHVKMAIELRGQAPGVKQGGIVEQLAHEVEIECEASSIPDKLEINIKELQVGGELKASDLRLPPGVTLLTDPDMILVHCVEPLAEEEAVAGEGATAEPEVIGRKAEEEEDE